MFTWETILAIFIAYLFGSVSSAIIVCKILRLPDPRTVASQNPGATNVLRIGGKGAALLTLLGDVLKGTLPIVIAKALGFAPYALAFMAFAAFFGHLFPIFFGFRGGKGVATALGVLAPLFWPAAIAWVVIWIAVAGLSRYVSLASISATAIVPAFLWYWQAPIAYVICFIVIAILVIVRHANNIHNIWNQSEHRIGA